MKPLKSSGNIEGQWLFATLLLTHRGEMRHTMVWIEADRA